MKLFIFLVEIRKLLDQEEGSQGERYRLLRFYCDWAVHTSKDYITPEIKEVMEKVDKSIVYREGRFEYDPPIFFIYKEDLKKEMKDFLKKFKLPNKILIDDNWFGFVHLLNNVLIDQPINRPTKNIESFTFKPITTKEGAAWVIKFSDFRGTLRFRNELERG